MRFSKILRMFKQGNVCVTGLRGTGKDVLFGNVIARRKEPYVGNLDYGGKFHKLDIKKLDCGGNTYDNLLKEDILYYEYPYPIGSDVYLSDCGVYFPSQYCNELNKKYGSIAVYQCLSRQLSKDGNFHVNAQALNRVWDKIREQSDTYIRCRKCIVIFGFVLQFITTYDKYQSCVDRVQPCRIHVPILGDKNAKMNARIYKDNFFNTNGTVKNHILLYRNKSAHDTYYFKELFANGR